MKKNHYLFILLLIWSSSFYSCKMEDSISRNIDNLPKEIADCKKWLTSQEVASGFLEERDIDWSKAEMKTLPDGNTLQIKLKIGRELNSVGNDSITELQIAKLKYGYEGRIKVSSYYDEKRAFIKYYSLTGTILEEGDYNGFEQSFILLKQVPFEKIRTTLEATSFTRSYDDSLVVVDFDTSYVFCENTLYYLNSETPLYINEEPNSEAFNCHTYVWGTPDEDNPCYSSDFPLWNNCPDINNSGYSQVQGSSPQAGDKWVSYGYFPDMGYVAIHSAIIVEVENGIVTRLQAKCGENGIFIYDPNCSYFSTYMTGDIRYYR